MRGGELLLARGVSLLGWGGVIGCSCVPFFFFYENMRYMRGMCELM